jgi:hypothetical protein
MAEWMTLCGWIMTSIFILLHVKKPASFHDLQRLVEHGGGIDGDFSAHMPIRVVQSLFQGSALNLFLCP